MTDRHYWFRAKSYGWGWFPVTWQGWAVLAVFLALVMAGAVLVLPRFGVLIFDLYVVVLAALLIIVCWRTGEPPGWRWGDD